MTTTTADNKTDIQERLNTINSLLIATSQQSYMLGRTTSTSPLVDASTAPTAASPGSILYYLLNYESFKSWVNDIAPDLWADQVLAQIFVATNKNALWESALTKATGTSSEQSLIFTNKDFLVNYTYLLKASYPDAINVPDAPPYSASPAPATAAPGSFTREQLQTTTPITTGYLYKNTNSLNMARLQNGTSATPTTFGSLLELLNSIRGAYNLLEDSTFASYKAGTRVVVNLYELTTRSGAKSYVNAYGNPSAGETNIETLVNKILGNVSTLDPTSSNLDAIRRVLFGFELIIHCLISTHLLKTVGSTVRSAGAATGPNVTITYAAIEAKIKNLLESNIQKIISYNNEMYSQLSTSDVQKLRTFIRQRMEAYNAKRDTIEKVNTNIAEQKLNITIENNNVQTNKSYLKKSTIIFYVFLAVFVVSLAILVGTLRGTGTAQKKLTVAIIFAVGVIALIVMYFVVHKLLKEGFSSLPSSSIRTQINELGGLDKIQQLYMDTAWGAFEEYLSNTINLAFLMETYRKYGDISNAITKEYNYYDKLGVQLKQSSQTLHSVQTNDYRTSKILQYRVYLFIQILIIVSLAAFINIYTPNSPSLHNVVIVLAAFVSLFFVYLYIFNTNNLVHTDATKLYWGKPSEELLK